MHGRAFPAVTAGIVLLVLTVVFFPTLFFGRVVSPLDVLYNDPPWRAVHHPVEVTNPDLERPATAYLPLLEAARRDGASIALWNPYLAGGAPGVLAWNDGLLSPTVLPFLPWIDPALLPNAVILAKLLLAFVGTWLLLRRLGLGQTAASVGGAAFALSGPLTAAWLWPSSATGAALPLLLYAADRVLAAAKPWRTVAAGTLAWLAFLAGGGPGETAVGLVLVAAWVIVRFGEARRRGAAGLRHLAAVAASASIAGALLAPSFGLFAASLGPSGALARPAAHHAFGWQAFRLLVDPFAFGDPRRATYSPPPALSGMAFHDTVLAIGFVTVVLALLGLASRRRGIVFWGAVCGLALAGLAWAPAGVLLPAVPGGRLVPVARLGPVLALGAAVLAGFGAAALEAMAPSARWRPAVALLAVAVVLEQGLFAGHLLAFLPPGEARWAPTPGVAALERDASGRPFRVAPLGDALPADTPQAYGLEDVRARYASTAAWRELLTAVDPQVRQGPGRSLRLNAATVDLTHPYLRALGARWVAEDPRYHLVEFSLGQNTIEVEPRNALVGPLSRGSRLTQDLSLPAGCSRIGLNAVAGDPRPAGWIEVELVDEITGGRVRRWRVDARGLAEDGFRWLNLPPGLDFEHRFRLRLWSRISTGRLWLRRTETPRSLDGPLAWNGRRIHGDLGLSFDASGYVPVYSGRDLRVWENRRAAPRFWVVREVAPGTVGSMVAARPPFDLARVAVVPPPEVPSVRRALGGPRRAWSGSVVLEAGRPSRYRLRVELSAPGILVSSIALWPRLWRAAVDGRRVAPMRVNGAFLGLAVPAGEHTVEVGVALPWSWRTGFWAGVAAWLAFAATPLRRRRGEAR